MSLSNILKETVHGVKIRDPLEVGIAMHEEMEDKLSQGYSKRCVFVEIHKPAKPFPKVGDTVTIKHQVKRTSSGDVLGVQRADGKGYNATITAVYMDGTVRTGISDIWEVKPGTQGHWETVNPMHERK